MCIRDSVAAGYRRYRPFPGNRTWLAVPDQRGSQEDHAFQVLTDLYTDANRSGVRPTSRAAVDHGVLDRPPAQLHRIDAHRRDAK